MMLFRYKTGSFFLLFSLISLAVNAQTIITGENFETYTAEGRLCTQAPAYWYTWNDGPGTAEDPFVSDSLAFQGSKSLAVTGINDVLLDLKGKTSGRYEISFFTRVPAGKTGFFGLLQKFSGNNSNWGMQCFFDTGNKGTVQAGGNSADFSFATDQWTAIRNIIDIDNDHGEFYVGGVLALEWQWSKGLNGDSGLLQLGALNFFAWNSEQRLPLMFVDSILYTELPEPDPPRNLSAVVNGNSVTLLWDPPSSGTPTGYKVYRDSTIIAPLVTGVTYSDPSVYPGKYSYSVKAVYTTEMSKPAGPVEATVAGGTLRKFVLLEIATGTWCTYCPGAAMGADDLVKNGDRVAVIEYHNGDTFSNTDADSRNSYYNVPGYPTAHFDGLEEYAGGNMTQSIYPVYLPIYNRCIPKLSLFTLDMAVTKTGDRDLQVTLTARKIYSYPDHNLKLHLVLTETQIPKTWQTIMKEVNFVCRKMYPDHNGTTADFSTDSVITANFTVSVDSSYNYKNCSLVAFLQDNVTKEVLQADEANLGTLGIEQKGEISLSVYPNPVCDKISIVCGTILQKISVIDMTGRSLRDTEPRMKEAQIDLTGLAPGTYILNIHSANSQVMRKFLITPRN